jgi:type IV fimbrial biogenesis protein FimT
MAHRLKNQTGFTLIELMVTISIMGILIAIASPSFSRMITGNKISSVRDNLISSIQFAKTEAISLNTNIAICPSSNGSSCSGTSDWTQGWIVYQDSGTGTTSTVASVVRIVNETTNVNVIHNGVTASLNPAVFIRYVPEGFARYSGPITAQTIGFCDPSGEADGRSILVSATTGQVRPGSIAEAGCPP